MSVLCAVHREQGRGVRSLPFSLSCCLSREGESVSVKRDQVRTVATTFGALMENRAVKGDPVAEMVVRLCAVAVANVLLDGCSQSERERFYIGARVGLGRHVIGCDCADAMEGERGDWRCEEIGS